MTVSAPPKPETFNGDLANLPEVLKSLTELQRWCCRRWEWEKGKWTKVHQSVSGPLEARAGRHERADHPGLQHSDHSVYGAADGSSGK
jgi:hypothetical protein